MMGVQAEVGTAPSPWLLIAISITLSPFSQRLAELCFLVALCLSLARIDWRGRESWVKLAPTLLGLVFVSTWLALRIVPPWGLGFHTFTNPDRMPVTFLDYAPYLWAFALLFRQPIKPSEARGLFRAIAITTPFWAVLSIAQIRLLWGGSLSWSVFGLPVLQADLPAWKAARLSAGFGNWNSLGLMMLFCIVAIATLMLAGPADDHSRRLAGLVRRVGRLTSLSFLLGASFGMLILSGSRSSWLPLPVILLALVYFQRARIRPLVLLLPILLASLTLLLAVRDYGAPSLWARTVVPDVVTTRVRGERGIYLTTTAQWRLDLYACAFDLIRERPLAGWGLGGFALECEARDKSTRNHAHNAFLQVASELGLPAAAVFSAWLGWLLLRGGKQIAHAPDTEDRNYRLGFFLIVLATVIASQPALSVLHDNRLEIVFWVSLAGLAAPPCSRHRSHTTPVAPIERASCSSERPAGAHAP